MTRSKKTPTNADQPNLFEQLRVAEQEERQLPADALNLIVNALARDPEAELDFDDVRRALKDNGKTVADLERMVQAVRPLATGLARVAQEKIDAAQAEVTEIGSAREALTAALNGKLPDEATKREFGALSRRLSQAHARIKAARKQLADFNHRQACIIAELRGEAAPEREKARATAQPIVEVVATPSQTKRPAKYDPYDPHWQMCRSPNGGPVYYSYKGQRVSA